MSADTTSLRNVLVIAYYFPPMGLSGVQRTLKFVKYLPQFGWQPTVLTVTPTGYFAQDETLLDEIKDLNIEIIRAGSLDANRFFKKQRIVKLPSERWGKFLTFTSDLFFIPDNKIGWKRRALQAAMETMNKTKFDVIFATAPPFTDFLIGTELHDRYKIPLILDYRDPWLEYPVKYYPTLYHRWKTYAMEKIALQKSSKIIVTNRRVKELILKQYVFLDYEDIVILPQGYDPADFDFSSSKNSENQKFTITYTGVFNGDRTPKYFFEALKKIFSDSPDLKEKIEARFVGNFQDEYIRLIQAMELDQNIVMTGYVSHAESIKEVMKSDCVWLMLMNDRQSPGKLYEYIASKKPILACVPDGFIKQTVLETGAGVVVDPTHVEAISNAILQLYDQFKKKQLPSTTEEIVQKYNRVALTNELSKIMGFLIDYPS
ncbi:MAG: glycosyltransferase family 4 protein [Bacteroidota bacterium]